MERTTIDCVHSHDFNPDLIPAGRAATARSAALRGWRPVALVCLLALAFLRPVAAGAPTEGEIRLFLNLARMAKASYDDSSDIVTTPAGCVALVREYGNGVLVVAFRGSMLGDRDPDRKPFSNLGGKVMRRNYRDWVATNLKQVTGFLPRQYIEAAELLLEQIRLHPDATRVYVTGHSKGGGAAEYAAINAWLSRDRPGLPPITTVTFNAAVVRERNWRRLYRTHSDESVNSLRGGDAPSVTAVFIQGDPVSDLARDERPSFSRTVELVPSGEMSAGERHGIDAVIRELERLAGSEN